MKSTLIQKIAFGVIGTIAGLILAKTFQSFFKEDENVEVQGNAGNSNRNGSNDNQQRHHVDTSIMTIESDVQNYDLIQQNMTCPITNCIMRNPFIVSQCGHTFERRNILQWVKKQGNCPLCKVQIQIDKMRINYQLKQVIRAYQKNKKVLTKKQQNKKIIQSSISK